MSFDKPTDRRFTDAANGERFVNDHGDRVRYVAEDKSWVIWDGVRWKPDTLSYANELSKETARRIYGEAKAGESFGAPCSSQEAAEWATASLSTGKVAATLKAASTEPQVAISAEVLDSNIYLLGCANGTVDLRTGELRQANQEDMITKSTGIDFDPDAKCPKWESFVEWTMLDRLDLVEYLQRMLGMSLCGDVSERVVLFMHGQGDNGKTVILKTVCHIAGDYGLRMATATLEAAKFARGGSSHSDDIARLKGRRFVYASEIEDGTKLATALLKDFTGDEGKLTARAIYKGTFEFKPEFTPWIGANHKPNAPSDDQAIWNRLRLIPFDNIIDKDKKDKTLYDTLVGEEAPGILAWLVRGCVDWQHRKVETPAVVMEATADYRNEMDTFGDFIVSILEDPYVVEKSPSKLRERYNRWAKDNTDDDTLMTQRQFKAHMLARGWMLGKVDGSRAYIAPTTPVHRANYGEMARLAAVHKPTDEENAEYEAEVRALYEADEDEAHEYGFESAAAMYEAERSQREG